MWGLQVSASVLVGMVILYVILCILRPYMVKAWNHLRWRINNIISSESYYTYATSSRAFSLSSQSSLGAISRAPSLDDSKEENKDNKAELELDKQKKGET